MDEQSAEDMLAEMFGMKPKKPLTEEQKFGKALLDILKKNNTGPEESNTQSRS